MGFMDKVKYFLGFGDDDYDEEYYDDEDEVVEEEPQKETSIFSRKKKRKMLFLFKEKLDLWWSQYKNHLATMKRH